MSIRYIYLLPGGLKSMRTESKSDVIRPQYKKHADTYLARQNDGGGQGRTATWTVATNTADEGEEALPERFQQTVQPLPPWSATVLLLTLLKSL